MAERHSRCHICHAWEWTHQNRRTEHKKNIDLSSKSGFLPRNSEVMSDFGVNNMKPSLPLLHGNVGDLICQFRANLIDRLNNGIMELLKGGKQPCLQQHLQFPRYEKNYYIQSQINHNGSIMKNLHKRHCCI